jgi:hypothetical protein
VRRRYRTMLGPLVALGPGAIWLVKTLAGVGVFLAAEVAVEKMSEENVTEEQLAAENVPLTPGSRMQRCDQWNSWRNRARATLGVNLVTNYFDPYWHQHKPEVCGAGATLRSARLAVMGANILIEQLANRPVDVVVPPVEAESGVPTPPPLPPYIPSQNGSGGANIVEADTAETRPLGSTLLPILFIGSAVAAIIYLYRGDPA